MRSSVFLSSLSYVEFEFPACALPTPACSWQPAAQQPGPVPFVMLGKACNLLPHLCVQLRERKYDYGARGAKAGWRNFQDLEESPLSRAPFRCSFPPFSLSLCLFVSLPLCLSFSLRTFLPFSLSLCRFVSLPLCLAFSPSLSLSLHLFLFSFCLSVCIVDVSWRICSEALRQKFLHCSHMARATFRLRVSPHSLKSSREGYLKQFQLEGAAWWYYEAMLHLCHILKRWGPGSGAEKGNASGS